MTESYKTVIIGDSRVGKTSIIARAATNEFDPTSVSPTVALGNATKIPVKANDSDIDIEIWDTAGTEQFQSLAVYYARDAVACICVFDLGNLQSFLNINAWIQMILQVGSISNFYIVGNKFDLVQNQVIDPTIDGVFKYLTTRDDQDAIEDAELQVSKLKDTLEGIKWSLLFASAQSGFHIEDLFQQIGEDVVSSKENEDTTTSIKIKDTPKKSGCGC